MLQETQPCRILEKYVCGALLRKLNYWEKHRNVHFTTDCMEKHAVRGNWAAKHAVRGNWAAKHTVRGNWAAKHTVRWNWAAKHTVRGNWAAKHAVREN